MADQKLALTPEQLADFLDKFKEKCQLASPVHQPCDLGSLTENLNDPDIQRLLDAEHGEIDVEVFRYLAYRKANTGNISNFINFGKLSDKDEKSARIKNILRSMRLTQRIDNKTKEIEKRNKLLVKDIEQLKKMMVQKNTELDENVKTIEENISMEIGNIMKNINAFKEKEKEMKSAVDKETKKLKADEARAKAGMERKIEEMDKLLTKAKEATDKNIREMEEHEAKEKRYFDKRVQKMKDDKEQKFRIMKLKFTETKNDIEAKLTKMNEYLIQKETETQKNIKSMQDMLAVKEEEFKKSIEIMRLYEAEKTSELEAKHQKNNEIHAQEKENIEKNIIAMQNTLTVLEKELKDNIKNLRQQEAKKKIDVELKLQKIDEIKAQKLNDIEKNNPPTQIKSAKKKRQIAEVEFQRSIDIIQQYEAEKGRETGREVQDIKVQKKNNIEKNHEPRRKKIALCEWDASGNQIPVRHTRLHSQMTHEALTPLRPARRQDYPNHRQVIISERHRWSQRSHRTPD